MMVPHRLPNRRRNLAGGGLTMSDNQIRLLKICGLTVGVVLFWSGMMGQWKDDFPQVIGLCAMMVTIVLYFDTDPFGSPRQRRQGASNVRSVWRPWVQSVVEPTTKSEVGRQIRACLRARLGDETFKSWFNALEFEDYDGSMVTMSVPVKFLRNWIHAHYFTELRECCRDAFPHSKYACVISRSVNREQMQ